ncbi:polysaccharide biosynthesis tyrosine autokinase [Nocardioides cavernaquae]|uniref:non-specific protein-tyrosine kinase n=1 Tax=Nocardioides cavernaquae TaxID=2321396 RepID=A0A3A5H3U9_9ACTN|nr:polysaccharide biosynthesis tyrosine autokinase [Nocardioides cavernaquae]RJS45416.1 polysaccharide biosynthesis tyrosine autokinase [Nocardioides cavernaquae]
MDLRDYLRILRRHWLLIALCFAAALVVSGLVTSRMIPQYSSSSRIFISTNNSSSDQAYQDGLFSTQRVASYADLVTGKDMAADVIEDLGLDMNPTELAANVTAQAVPETVLLTISVTDPDPDLAQLLTRTYGEQLALLVADLETPPGGDGPVLKATTVDSAGLPTAAVSPNWTRNLGLAGVLGLLLGFGLAVLRELLDTSVKSAEDITELAESSVMASIAYDPATVKRPLVSDLGSHEPRAEAFRVLRTNLQFVDVDASSKAYVVTSSVPGEGKSTTALNTAITLAQTGQNILLIDGDLRRPQVANVLGLEPAVGLTTVLVGKIDLAAAVQKHETGLHVLTSGTVPPNPAELLQSQAMASLLTAARSTYDVIVIDAPPLLPVTDAALLASMTDGALLVVRHSRTTRDQLRGAHDRLESVGADTLGVVFNMVPKKGGGAYGYGYGYGYGYAPEPEPAGKRRGAKAVKPPKPEKPAKA